MKAKPKYFNNRGFMSKNLISLLDMLAHNDGSHDLKLIQLKNAILKLDTELAYHRRLQGIFNLLFGVTVGVLMVVVLVT